MVRSDVVDRFAEFGTVLSMFENFGPNIGEPQAARGAYEQADAELVLEVSNASADGRGRQLEAACRFREAIRFHNLSENRQRIQVCHRFFDLRNQSALGCQINYPKFGKYICSLGP